MADHDSSPVFPSAAAALLAAALGAFISLLPGRPAMADRDFRELRPPEWRGEATAKGISGRHLRFADAHPRPDMPSSTLPAAAARVQRRRAGTISMALVDDQRVADGRGHGSSRCVQPDAVEQELTGTTGMWWWARSGASIFRFPSSRSARGAAGWCRRLAGRFAWIWAGPASISGGE